MPHIVGEQGIGLVADRTVAAYAVQHGADAVQARAIEDAGHIDIVGGVDDWFIVEQVETVDQAQRAQRFGANHTVVDIWIKRRRGRGMRGLIGEAIGGRDRGNSSQRRSGECQQPFVPLAENGSGNGSHRRTVEAAAEMAADAARASGSALHRLEHQFAKPIRVVLIPAIAHIWHVERHPICECPGAAVGGDGKRVAWREPAHRTIKRLARLHRQTGQVAGKNPFFELSRHIRQDQERARDRREGKALRADGIEELAFAKRITGAKNPLLRGVPDHEGKGAQ